MVEALVALHSPLVNKRYLGTAAEARASVQEGLHVPAAFRAALLDVPPAHRDAWFDMVMGLGELHDDGPELPRGCVPYLPCSVNTLVRVVDKAPVGPHDVFVDIGSGVGRAAILVHLLTGASAIGIEVQPALVDEARRLAARLFLSRVPTVQGDAAQLARSMATGSVFFLYCPFGGERLERLLDDLEPFARTRDLKVCSVDLPLPARAWLAPEPGHEGDLTIYRSTLSP